MGFYNNYPNRKDKRKSYRGAASFDQSCRPHGSCPWCERRRTFFDIKRRSAAEQGLRDYIFPHRDSLHTI